MYILCIIAIVVTIIISYFVFHIKMKEIKKLTQDHSLDKITQSLPNNKEVCKEMLNMLENNTVQIEEDENTSNSLYIAISNKIILGKMKIDFVRFQTIAHECIHSIQDKRLLKFNFIFSNFYLFYFFLAIIFTVTKLWTNFMLVSFFMLLIGFICYTIRSFLEVEAMTKAPFLAEKYLKDKLNLQDCRTILQKYDIINKLGLPFVCYTTLTNVLIKLLIYLLVVQFIIMI